jgi:cation:H+ antiporter
VESFFRGLPAIANLAITIGSLVLLVAAADFAIGRAIATARQYRVSPLVIGTTLVAMSTSLAELAVNMAVTLTGSDNSIIVGNILGSNLVNIGIGLGVAAFITPIRTHTIVIEREIVLYFAVTAMFVGFVLDRVLTGGEGLVLVGCFLIILFLIYQYASRDRESLELPSPDVDLPAHKSTGMNAIYSVGALVVLVVAAEMLVESVSALAAAAGVSSYIISLTVVGIGTSVPEIATSVQAARRGEVDLVLGNVFGSNVFNICIALGLPALIRRVTVPRSALDDVYFINVYGLIVVFLILTDLPFLDRNRVLGRWGGMLVAGTYVLYLVYKLLRGT